MINQKIKLLRPGLFLPFFCEDEEERDKVIVRPTILSICAADQRYFNGARPANILKEKLPMSLIHEAIGRVVYDPCGRMKAGELVVLLPNGGERTKPCNYKPGAFFRSSSVDGFTQEFVKLNSEEVIPFYSEFPKYYVFTELLSVCFHAISQIPPLEWRHARSVGIWGTVQLGTFFRFA